MKTGGCGTLAMEIPFDLDLFLESLQSRVGHSGTVVVRHPAELRHLRGIPEEELGRVAARHDLRCLRRHDGTQYEFMRRPG